MLAAVAACCCGGGDEPEPPQCLEHSISCEDLRPGDLCGGCRDGPIHGECTRAGVCAWQDYASPP